jgi:thymidylate kinase
MAGRTDLDLLVHPEHAGRFKTILQQHAVKPVVSPPDKQYPAVEDHVGFDPKSGQLFHLHVHYQLVLGEQFVKNYRLPLEQAFLNNVQTYRELVKIPAPELELVVLAIRALLKYRDRDVIKDILAIRSPGLPLNILREFEYLLEQTNKKKVAQVLESQVNFISPEIVLELLNTVVNTPRSGRVLYRLRRDLRRELSVYQRNSRWWAMRKYFGTLAQRWLPLSNSHPSKKVPATGGVMLAVIGADGAGKSTLIKTLRKWLSWKFEVHNYYMGSREPSLLPQLLRPSYRIVGKVRRMWSSLTGEKNIFNGAFKRLERLLRNLYHLSIARDRYRRYTAAKRWVAQGAIVICDRYPLAVIHHLMEERPMDGPRIMAETQGETNTPPGRMARIEQNVYKKIHPPDHIFILQVSPKVSLQRKPEHDPKMIETKSRVLQQMDTQGLHVTRFDADQPFEQVLLEIKTALWQLL